MTIDLETVVRLWKQAGGTELQDGLRDDGSSSVYYDIWPEQLEKFVQLVLEYGRKPLTDEQIERLREKTFSTNNPYCPVDRKSMRKAVRAAEIAHGIINKEGSDEK